jgi:hypothetical protein
MNKRIAIATVALSASLGSLTPVVFAHAEGRTEYMPCDQEDSVNCVWDAKHMGNGTGKSFFVGENGRVWYLPHHIAHYLIYGK